VDDYCPAYSEINETKNDLMKSLRLKDSSKKE
jgi:hypothetical protein